MLTCDINNEKCTSLPLLSAFQFKASTEWVFRWCVFVEHNDKVKSFSFGLFYVVWGAIAGKTFQLSVVFENVRFFRTKCVFLYEKCMHAAFKLYYKLTCMSLQPNGLTNNQARKCKHIHGDSWIYQKEREEKKQSYSVEFAGDGLNKNATRIIESIFNRLALSASLLSVSNCWFSPF